MLLPTLIRPVLFAMGSGKMQTKTRTVMRITNWLVKARETCIIPLIQGPSTEGIGWDAVFPAWLGMALLNSKQL